MKGNRLMLLATTGRKEYSELASRHLGVISLLKHFKIRPTLADFIQISSGIAFRYYTLSSSKLKNPSKMEFSISLTSFENEKRLRRLGLASKFFQELHRQWQQGKKAIKLRIVSQESPFELPKTKKTPCILVGPGTGVSPMKAIAEEKEAGNENIGEVDLFFGCRRPSEDFIYKEELENLARSKAIENPSIAFSREGAQKVYVQHRLAENGERITNKILKENALVYICGYTTPFKLVEMKPRKSISQNDIFRFHCFIVLVDFFHFVF